MALIFKHDFKKPAIISVIFIFFFSFLSSFYGRILATGTEVICLLVKTENS